MPILRTVLTVFSFLSLLISCASMEPVPLYSSGQSFDPPAVLPSLSIPEAGSHPYAWAAYVTSPRAESGAWGEGGAAGGGLVFQQSSLWNDWSAGLFAGLDGSMKLSRESVDYTSDTLGGEAPLSDEQKSWFPSDHWSETLAAVVRGGVQVKYFIGTSSVYGIGAARFEQGDYLSFRKKIDGVGRLVNLYADPLTAGLGFGIDTAIGYRGLWALGSNLELVGWWARTQSFVSAEIDETINPPDGQWVTTRAAGGRVYQVLQMAGSLYFDLGHVRVSSTTSVEFNNLEGLEDGVGGTGFTVAYRW